MKPKTKKEKVINIIFIILVCQVGNLAINKIFNSVPDYYKEIYNVPSDIRKAIARISAYSFCIAAIYSGLVFLIPYHLDKHIKESIKKIVRFFYIILACSIGYLLFIKIFDYAPVYCRDIPELPIDVNHSISNLSEKCYFGGFIYSVFAFLVGCYLDKLMKTKNST